MKYQLFHKVFGWDYIVWKNTADQGIARVQTLPSGEVYYWRYKLTKVVDIVKNSDQVLWLTCSPAKYFSSERGGRNDFC